MNEQPNPHDLGRPRLHASWPAPDPASRIDVTERDLRSGRPGRPSRGRRGVAALVVAGALLAGAAGYAVTNHDSGSSSSPPAVFVPAPNPSRVPSTTPSNGSTSNGASNAPSNGSSNTPSNGSSSGNATTPPTTGAGPSSASASTTALSVGVVDIDTNLAYQGAAAAGTGMIVSADGEVLTNNHVIDGATSVTVTVVSTGKSYAAKVVGTDPTADVALIKMDGASGLQTANFGDSSAVQVGDAVTAAGNAGGVGGAPTVASGEVTGLDQQITASDANGANSEQLTGLLEINAALQPGESGGPLYNASGQVIGMNTAGSATGRRRVVGTDNYAIPINTAMSVIKQIETGKASDTITIGLPGFLGVEVAPDDTQTQTTNGATVQDIVSGTPAEQLGLHAGDVITAVDGKAVTATKDLGTLLGAHHGGDKVTITWTDANGQSHSSSVTLVDGPAN